MGSQAIEFSKFETYLGSPAIEFSKFETYLGALLSKSISQNRHAGSF